MKQTISILVENRAGVLNKITNLFSRRAFNIDSLAVGVTDDKTVSRITIVVDNDKNIVEQIEKQLNKLIEVIKVRTIEDSEVVGKELVIIKVSSTQKNRGDIMNICDIMGAKIEDISNTTLTAVLADATERIDLFEGLLRPFSILEVARTGMIAVQRGSGFIAVK
jgi:acetolactate synthase-1/3 small subunit